MQIMRFHARNLAKTGYFSRKTRLKFCIFFEYREKKGCFSADLHDFLTSCRKFARFWAIFRAEKCINFRD